jgi:hypothetical protein
MPSTKSRRFIWQAQALVSCASLGILLPLAGAGACGGSSSGRANPRLGTADASVQAIAGSGGMRAGERTDAGADARATTTRTDAAIAQPDASRAPRPTPDAGHVSLATDAGAHAPASDAGSDAGARHGLRGAFLELSNDHAASVYSSAITEMAALGMDTAIVQTESYLESPDFSRNAVDRSLLHAVLDQAASSGLHVHLGLALPEWGNGDETLARDASFVDGAIAAAKTSLDTLLMDFAGDRAWTGCYLSLELWTPGTADQLGELPRYVREVSQYVKQQGAFAVSISPFVSDGATDGGTATRSAFSAIFADSAVDVVALQDGAGARGLSPAQLAGNLPYYRAMLDACAGKCEVWANVEAFAGNSAGAASWDRFLAQMQTLAPTIPSQISYEYTHDLASSGGDPGASALHTAYASWLHGP